jgi:hypothetical protein
MRCSRVGRAGAIYSRAPLEVIEGLKLLLRNWRIEELAGFAIEEGEAEAGGALAESAEDVKAMLGIIGGGSRILVAKAMLERSIDEDGQLAGRGGNGFGLADAVGQTPIEGPEGGVGATEVPSNRTPISGYRMSLSGRIPPADFKHFV